ncbi:MAG: 1-acyl-sn-glycerol-3-phosphate acyltransferase [Chitinophagales bacterium]
MSTFQFDDIRFYADTEVADVLKELAKNPMFLQYGRMYMPNWTEQQFVDCLHSLQSVHAFQKEIIYPNLQNMLSKSSNGLSVSGLEELPKDGNYLYISNHRDIIFDPASLNVSLHEIGRPTAAIAIGNNLFVMPWIEALVKLNKNFAVIRDAVGRDFVFQSQRLSAYIQQTILENNTSVWIAQREGRAKDGNDHTHPALLKMLGLSAKGDYIEHFEALQIVPMAISYEYDPCDLMKAKERYLKAQGTYQKTPQDDLKSMAIGLTGDKGRIHLAIGTVLKEELKAVKEMPKKNDQIQALTDLIDRQIHQNYHLWFSNYIAFDLLHETKTYANLYPKYYYDYFVSYIEEKIATLEEGMDKAAIRQLMLEMYANPVNNRFGL